MFFLLLYIGQQSLAQVEVFYDFSSNTVSASYSGCDPCLLGSVAAAQTCECRIDCLEQIPENYQEIIDECQEDCAVEFPNDPNAYHHCLNYCSELPYGDYNSCLNACGSPTFAQVEIVAYRYQYISSWARVPFHPWDFTGNYDITPWSPVLTGPNITFGAYNLPAPWPGVTTTSNTCYAVRLLILYSDNTECLFTGQSCNIIG